MIPVKNSIKIFLFTFLISLSFVSATPSDKALEKIPDHVLENQFTRIDFKNIDVSTLNKNDFIGGFGYLSANNVSLNGTNATITFNTNNSGVKYAVYYHPSFNKSRSEVRKNGNFKQNVYSKNGVVTLSVDSFSSWILALPDIDIGIDEKYPQINLHNYIDDPSDVDFILADYDPAYDEAWTGYNNPDTDRYTESVLWDNKLNVTLSFDSGSDEFYLDLSTQETDNANNNTNKSYTSVELYLDDFSGNIDQQFFDINVNTDFGGLQNETTPQTNTTLDDSFLYNSFDNDNLSGDDPLDISGNGNNATNQGANTGAVGILNQSFDFVAANSDEVNYGDGFTWANTGNSWTVNLWVNLDAYPANDADIFNLANTFDPSVRITLQSDGSLNYIYRDSSNIQIQPADVLSTGNWHMLSFRYDAGSNDLDAFINSTEVGTDNVDMTADLSGQVMSLMVYKGAPRYNDGRVDEFGIWGRALSDSEIGDLYNNSTGFNPYSEPSLSKSNDISNKDIIVNTTSGNFLEIEWEDYFNNIETNDTVSSSWYDVDGSAMVDAYTINSTSFTSNSGSNNVTTVYSNTGILWIFPQVENFDLPYNNTFSITVNEADSNTSITQTFNVTLRPQVNRQFTPPGLTLNTNEVTTVRNISRYYEYIGTSFINFDHNLASNELSESSPTYNSSDFRITYNASNNHSVEIESYNNNMNPINITYRIFPTWNLTSINYNDSDTGNTNFDNGTEDKQDVWTLEIEKQPVTQLASIADLNMGYDEVAIRDFNNYFTNYDNFTINFNHNNASHQLDQSTTSYNSSDFNITVSSPNNQVYVTFYSNSNDLNNTNITYTAISEGVNQIQTSFNFNISDLDPVQQIASPSDINMNYHNISYINISEFFINEDYTYASYNNITIEFIDEVLYVLDDNTTINGFHSYVTLNTGTGEYEYTPTGETWQNTSIEFALCNFCNNISQFQVFSFDENVSTTFEIGGYRGVSVSNASSINSTNVNLIISGEGEQPTMSSTGIFAGLTNLFPAAADITTGTGIAITLLIAMIIGIGGAFMLTPQNTTVVGYVIALLEILNIIFFTTLGYIPVWVTLMLFITLTAFAIGVVRRNTIGN